MRLTIATVLTFLFTGAGFGASAPHDKEQACPASSMPPALARGDAALKAANYAEAVRHYTPAAKCGNALAQSRLGYLVLNGQGTAQDDKIAAEWLRKAAEQGDVAAQVNFATLLRDGRGTPKDDAAAFKWYLAAAEQGAAEGQFSAGLMLQMGLGIRADQVEAAKWYYKAALQAQPLAQASLALIEIGILGQDKTQRASIVRAHAWARVAGMMGCSSGSNSPSADTTAEKSRRQTCDTVETVRRLASGALLPNELVDANKLADAWKPGSTSIAAPPSDQVARLTPAAENIKRQEALRENAQTKPTRTRELIALDRWISGHMNYGGVRAFVAVLPVQIRKGKTASSGWCVLNAGPKGRTSLCRNTSSRARHGRIRLFNNSTASRCSVQPPPMTISSFRWMSASPCAGHLQISTTAGPN